MNKMMSESASTEYIQWDLVIRPQRKWWDLRLDELWRYRDLIWLFVWRDFVSYYKQTILGPLWYLVQPILTTEVFTVIFGNIARLPTDGVPPFLFYMAGRIAWSYFSSCWVGTSNMFVVNAAVFGKVYFPRLCIPISIVISNLISFTLRLLEFLVFLFYFILIGSPVKPNLWILLLPLLMLIMAGLGLGMGIIVSSLTIKYRDLQQLMEFGVQLFMYSTPVIYPLSIAPNNWRWFLLINPMTPIVETFRMAFLGTSTLSPIYLLYSFVFTVFLLLTGILVFNHVESTFIDTV